MDKESLSHTRANCKYHIVFTPKYRRQVIYGQIRKDVGEILRTLCERIRLCQKRLDAIFCVRSSFLCISRRP